MTTPRQCECPQVWSGHGDVRPDPTRPDPDCPWHGDAPAWLDVTDHGAVYIINPVGQEAIDWIRRTAPEDVTFWGPHGIVVEPKYVADVLAAWEDR